MKLTITHLSEYSRLQLLLRIFLGMFYIMLPHGAVLMILAVLSVATTPIVWLGILLNGKYPRWLFGLEVGLLRWQLRVNARLLNLVDGYPSFGLHAEDNAVVLDVPFPERSGRVHLVVRLLFGWIYCLLPHGLVLLLRNMASLLLVLMATVPVLVSGHYPEQWHRFNVNTLRHTMRVRLYMGALTDDYPSFQ